MPVLSVVVRLDGTPAAVETTRTLLEQALPMGRFPVAQQEWANDSARTLAQWQQLANVVILVSLPIAGAPASLPPPPSAARARPLHAPQCFLVCHRLVLHSVLPP